MLLLCGEKRHASYINWTFGEMNVPSTNYTIKNMASYNSNTLCAWRQNELLIRGFSHQSSETDVCPRWSIEQHTKAYKRSSFHRALFRNWLWNRVSLQSPRCEITANTSGAAATIRHQSINRSITWLCVFYSVVFRSLNSCKCGFGAADLLWVVSGAPSPPPLHPQRLPLHSGCRLNPRCSRTGTELRTCTLESSMRGGVSPPPNHPPARFLPNSLCLDVILQ